MKVTVSAAQVRHSSEQVSEQNTGLYQHQVIDSEKLKDEKQLTTGVLSEVQHIFFWFNFLEPEV